MRKAIFDSKNKQKILYVLVQHPKRFFSIKELSLRTGVPQRHLKTIITGFAKQQLLNYIEKYRQRFFQLDRRSGVVSEFSRLFPEATKPRKKSIRDRDFLEKLLAGTGDVKLIILTGVFTGLPKSPVDLLVVGSISQARLEKAVQILEKIEGLEINYSVMPEHEYRSRLYSFDWFLKEIMERDPLVLLDRFNRKKGERYMKTLYVGGGNPQ